MVATICALLYLVAFFDVEVGDAAHGGGAEVDIGLGLDLAGAADDRGQVLARDFGGQHLGVAGLLLVDHEGHKRGNDNNSENNQENFLHVAEAAPGHAHSSLRN